MRVLDLSNTALSWSSNLFAGPSELHLGFRDCDAVADILADELFGIFNASSRLEKLSLAQFGQGHQSEKEWDDALAGEFCPVV